MINHPNRSRKSTLAASVATVHNHEQEYPLFEAAVRSAFSANTAMPRLFRTDAQGLFDTYLDALPASERQTHNCHACRKFFDRFGGLVAVEDNGDTRPIMWSGDGAIPDYYDTVRSALAEKVRKARISSVFLCKETVWGTPRTGEWTHLSVTPPSTIVYRERALTPGQAMASTKENFKDVMRALSDFTAPMLDEALRILSADALSRSSKFKGPVEWLRQLHDRPKGRKGENVVWLAIATAPEGYCHPRASVVGSLLGDIAAGMDFDDIKRRFEAKVHPLIYQRPQAAPTAGNIKAAEALVEKLGIGPSLERRFARIDELATVWLPAVDEKPASGGVFGHLQPKNAAGSIRSVDLPPVTMTWEKFARTVLSTAAKIEVAVPSHGPFIALTTAVNAEAPPILKWDRDDERNPVAWYVYPGGSPAAQWGLQPGWAKVTAITTLPPMWGSRPSAYLGEGMVLVIDGARDTTNTSNALFPECLKDDFHGVRATIEAYSKAARLSGREEASACGYDLRKGHTRCSLRALVNGAWSTFNIDRWD